MKNGTRIGKCNQKTPLNNNQHRPNILVFVMDGCQGKVISSDSGCIIPNFKQIMERGMTFTRAYTPTPVCSPARASLMTSLLPHNHGVLQVEHCVDSDQSVLRADKPHWAMRLAAAGYQTAYFGKWHIERSLALKKFGWKYFKLEQDILARMKGESISQKISAAVKKAKIKKYLTRPRGYNKRLQYAVIDIPPADLPVNAVVNCARAYIKTASQKQKPWCAFISFPQPNEELICSKEIFNLYKAGKIKLPANLKDKQTDKPAIYRRSAQTWKTMAKKEWQMLRTCYYARITEIDRAFGRLIKDLEANKVLDKTLIIITSDHGRYLGAHGMDNHQFGSYEEIYNVPLIISGTGIPQNLHSNARVGLHDLSPTLLELAGADPIPGTDSRSFAAVLKNPRAAVGFQNGYAEYHGTRFPLMQRVYWDNNWKYVFNGFDYDELYNLKNDPHELHNLACNPSRKRQKEYMMKKIWEKLKGTGDIALAEAQYDSLRLAPVGPAQ